jgi:hypothetical protein
MLDPNSTDIGAMRGELERLFSLLLDASNARSSERKLSRLVMARDCGRDSGGCTGMGVGLRDPPILFGERGEGGNAPTSSACATAATVGRTLGSKLGSSEDSIDMANGGESTTTCVSEPSESVLGYSL